MGKTTWAAIGTALAVLMPLLTFIATSGKDFFDNLAAIPKVLSAWASGLPLGMTSFGAALTVATLLWLKLLVWLPKARDGSKAHWQTDTVAICAGIFVCLAQQWFVSHGNGELIRATIVGFTAGMLGTYLGRTIRAVVAKKASPPLPAPKE